VDKILKGACDILQRAGKKSGIDGYGDRSRSRSWEIASALWSSVAGLGLGYTYPPASFEVEGQKVRTPGSILENKLATCLDTSLLFASALEQAGLNPIIILTKGHAFAGVWLQPQEFSQLIIPEAAAVRKRIELQELIVFETTLVTQSPPASFSAAIDAGSKQLRDEVELAMETVEPMVCPLTATLTASISRFGATTLGTLIGAMVGGSL
jgi:hypothetical protein